MDRVDFYWQVTSVIQHIERLNDADAVGDVG